MASFSDLLRGVNDRIGYNAEDPEREDNRVNWLAKFSAKPQKHISLDAERKMECVEKDGAVSTNDKTQNKLKIEHDCGTTTTWTFSNEKMAFDAKHKAYNEGGWKINVGAGAENKAVDKKWKVTGMASICGDDLGGAKLNTEANFEYNEKGVTTVKPKINIQVADEFNVGVSAKSDLKTMQEIFPQFVYNPKGKDSFYWARADVTRQWAMFGCDQKLKDSISHSFELMAGWNKDCKELKGYPVRIRGGVSYELSDQTTVDSSFGFGANWQVGMEVEHNIDSHWTVKASQSFESDAATPYHVGFTAAYKL
jgi:hypothetical protein